MGSANHASNNRHLIGWMRKNNCDTHSAIRRFAGLKVLAKNFSPRAEIQPTVWNLLHVIATFI